MNCIGFGFTRSKIKVTRVLFVKIWFLLLFLRTSYHRAKIFHMRTGLVEDMAIIDFVFNRLKVNLTGPGESLTPIDLCSLEEKSRSHESPL